MKKEKNIPTILGIILVVGLVAALVFLRRSTVFRSGASSDQRPTDVKITNITDNSFVVSWTTSKKVIGAVELIEEGSKRPFFDIRSSAGVYSGHYVKVDGLGFGKQYEFTIISGGDSFLDNNRPYRIKTAAMISGELPTANLASGTVFITESSPASGAIVYFSAPGIAPLSSLVTSQGNWAISLATAFSEDFSNLAKPPTGKSWENIFVQGGELGTSTALVYAEDDDPVPMIILGQNYDFTDDNNPLLSTIPTNTPLAGSRLGGGEEATVLPKEFEILNPENDEKISFPRPEIFGVGPEGGLLEIVIESPTAYEAEIEIGNTGDWRWSPPQDLTPGTHTLTIRYTDPKTNKTETFIRSFVVAAYAEENDPSFSATPSGVTSTPTVTIQPTATPTVIPTLIPTITQPATESGVPVSGFWEPTLILIIAGILLWSFLIALKI